MAKSNTWQMLGIRDTAGGYPPELEAVMRQCRIVDQLEAYNADPAHKIVLLYQEFNAQSALGASASPAPFVKENWAGLLQAVHDILWALSRQKTQGLERECTAHLAKTGLPTADYADIVSRAVAELRRVCHGWIDVEEGPSEKWLHMTRAWARRKMPAPEQDFMRYDAALRRVLADPDMQSATAGLLRGMEGDRLVEMTGGGGKAGVSNSISFATWTLPGRAPEGIILRGALKSELGATGTLFLEGMYQFVLGHVHSIPLLNAAGQHVMPLFDKPFVPPLKACGMQGDRYVQMMGNAGVTLGDFLARGKPPDAAVRQVVFAVLFQVFAVIQRCDFFLGMLHNDLHVSNVCVKREPVVLQYRGHVYRQDIRVSLIDLGRATFVWDGAYTCLFGEQVATMAGQNGKKWDLYPMHQRIDDVKSFLCYMTVFLQNGAFANAKVFSRALDLLLRDINPDVATFVRQQSPLGHIAIRLTSKHDGLFEPQFLLDRMHALQTEEDQLQSGFLRPVRKVPAPRTLPKPSPPRTPGTLPKPRTLPAIPNPGVDYWTPALSSLDEDLSSRVPNSPGDVYFDEHWPGGPGAPSP